jgi:hypothetical protein
MPDSTDDPVFGHFRCPICESKIVARKSDSERYLTMEHVPECCGKSMQLIGGSSDEHKPLAQNPNQLDENSAVQN